MQDAATGVKVLTTTTKEVEVSVNTLQMTAAATSGTLQAVGTIGGGGGGGGSSPQKDDKPKEEPKEQKPKDKGEAPKEQPKVSEKDLKTVKTHPGGLE
jgi:hypothetical protein